MKHRPATWVPTAEGPPSSPHALRDLRAHSIIGTLWPITVAIHQGIVRWEHPNTAVPLSTDRLEWRRLPDLLGPGRCWDCLLCVAVLRQYGDNTSAMAVIQNDLGDARFGLPDPVGHRFRASFPVLPGDWAYTEGWLQLVRDPGTGNIAPFPTDKMRSWLAEHFGGATRPSLSFASH